MTSGFQQQQPVGNFGFLKSAAKPQHGRSPASETPKLKEPRSFQPRPGH